MLVEYFKSDGKQDGGAEKRELGAVASCFA